MPIPKYALRIARLPQVFELLADQPEGMPLIELAHSIGARPDELREDLLAFYTADVNTLFFGLSRPTVIEFLGPEGDDDVDPNTAEVVRVVDERPADELGVEYLDASELGLIYSAARALLDMDPDDADLHGAIDALEDTMFGPAATEDEPAETQPWNAPLESLQDAIAAHHKVRISYSRTWTEGITDRVIDPYLLVQTRRGWEVDAGPPDDDQGRIRTFLLPNIREYAVLDDTFDPPADLDALLEQQRTTTRVRVRIAHDAHWAADFCAEHVTVVADDELTTTLDLDLLPPVEDRVGLLLLIAGEEALVVDPPGLVATGPSMATQLLRHHQESAPEFSRFN